MVRSNQLLNEELSLRARQQRERNVTQRVEEGRGGFDQRPNVVRELAERNRPLNLRESLAQTRASKAPSRLQGGRELSVRLALAEHAKKRAALLARAVQLRAAVSPRPGASPLKAALMKARRTHRVPRSGPLRGVPGAMRRDVFEPVAKKQAPLPEWAAKGMARWRKELARSRKNGKRAA